MPYIGKSSMPRSSPERPRAVNLGVPAKIAWALGRQYEVEREAVVATLEHARTERLDFADALIGTLNRHAGCETTLTFDAQAGKAGSFAPAL